jgi:hypothetical protein
MPRIGSFALFRAMQSKYIPPVARYPQEDGGNDEDVRAVARALHKGSSLGRSLGWNAVLDRRIKRDAEDCPLEHPIATRPNGAMELGA